MLSKTALRPKSKREIEALLSELRPRLEEVYGSRMRGLFLYGSYARGEAEAESDVDVMVVLDRVGGYVGEVRRSGGVIADISLAYRTSVTPVFVSDDAWREHNTAFLRNVREEGIAA